jgi:photosystem II stability/assembly factor-like uncharacterized protein
MKVISVLIFLTVIFSTIIFAQETIWQPVDPGGNGWLMFASIHPKSGHLYFSSDMNLSLLRSTDQGESWKPIANPVSGTAFYVTGDPSEPFTLYMNQIGLTPKSSGIWKSSDDGETWVHIYESEEFGISRSQSGVVDPENNQILYWTAADFGVRRSTDGGYSWKDVSRGLPKEDIDHSYYHCHALEIDHNSPVDQRRIYYPLNLGLYRMQEPDGIWQLVAGLPNSTCSDVEVCDGNVIYAAFPDHGLFRSMDGGKNWQKIDEGLDGKKPFSVEATDSRPNVVYVATERDEGIYGSQDGGNSFRLLTHRRYNSQRNWPMNYRQHEAASGQIMLIDPNDPYTLYLDYEKKTHDGGQSWQQYGMKEVRRDRWKGSGLTLLTDYRVVFDPNRPNVVWLGFSDTGLMLSEDQGESIINVISFHRGEVNRAAYWRDKLVRSSGSCVSMAVDPDLSTTIYASINGKNASNRAAVGGIVIKSVDSGWNWVPIYEKNGLDDGIVRSIIIDPSSPVHDRTVYVASYGNGIYKSVDDGNHFNKITPNKLFNGNRRLMWLEMAPSDPQILYLGVGGSYGIRPITYGPNQYPALKSEMYGGVFKTVNGGKTWKKCNSSREIPSVQDVAVHPFNVDIVYVAAWEEPFLVPERVGHPDWKKGGVFKSIDGGKSWELIFEPPKDEYEGVGKVDGICINPVAPEIIYAAVEGYGIYRTLDEGKTWEMIGKNTMDRMQRRYHSIDLNPHNPAEIWIAHFGNSFSKGIDYKADKYMKNKFYDANLIRNPGFEKLNESALPIHWKMEQPVPPKGEAPVISVSTTQVRNGASSIRFHLTQAYSNVPTSIPAEREQLRLEKEGKIAKKKRIQEEVPTGETGSWIYQKIDPYFTTLMRGRRVAIEMDVFIVERNLPTFWDRGSEMGEIPRDPPQAYVTEARDYNVHWLVAETSLEDLEPIYKMPAIEMKGKWYHCQAIGRVSEDAQWLRITVTGVGNYSGMMDLYIDNIRLSIVE